MMPRDSLSRAIAAIKKVCRETDEDSQGSPVIGDLATWEIEKRLIDAVTEALKKKGKK